MHNLQRKIVFAPGRSQIYAYDIDLSFPLINIFEFVQKICAQTILLLLNMHIYVMVVINEVQINMLVKAGHVYFKTDIVLNI